MTTQADKDWEEYQLGLQGTSTGSMHNQMALNDRYQAPASTSNNYQKQQRKTTRTSASTQGDEDFSPWFAIITFIATSIYLYVPVEENGIAALIVGGIAGVIVGKLYKVIIGLAIAVVAFYIFGGMQN